MNEAIHNIHLQLKKLAERMADDERRIDAQAFENNALRDEVKRLTADVARLSYKRAPLPASRAGRSGDDR